MSATGFGAVDGTKGTYSAVYAFDEANTSATEYGVCWPAQNMPTEYFESSYPWSVSTGDTEDISKIQVVLKNVKTRKTWNFSSMKADGSFYVNNDNMETEAVSFSGRRILRHSKQATVIR